MSMYRTGTSARQWRHLDPVEHLVVSGGSNEWFMWCSGAPAVLEVTATRRRCPRCLALARADIADLKPQPDEPTEFDWYVGRKPTRTPGTVREAAS